MAPRPDRTRHRCLCKPPPRRNPEAIGVGYASVLERLPQTCPGLLSDCALIELFDAHGVSFVSVTQSFNTSSSMGRLTLNVLLSFAQFERELIGERVRDKIAASKRRRQCCGRSRAVGAYCGCALRD
jgi:Resolvase, N terminal domain